MLVKICQTLDMRVEDIHHAITIF
ncbi:hypothetical protein NE477_11365 [Blautia marasmi]|uniref:Uncharacterized protein n=1 Tax=Blautia caccae TaxID=3133175 RepID=A0ABV1DMM7_9FIRM|nr:hypothetical protein [Blautia marasmi]MCQ4979570.1 hypothetical protein [Blautia producta]UOX60882.1 hypothetical protein K5I22_07505 [Clostridia bacterium UC5.1-1D4]